YGGQQIQKVQIGFDTAREVNQGTQGDDIESKQGAVQAGERPPLPGAQAFQNEQSDAGVSDNECGGIENTDRLIVDSGNPTEERRYNQTDEGECQTKVNEMRRLNQHLAIERFFRVN